MKCPGSIPRFTFVVRVLAFGIRIEHVLSESDRLCGLVVRVTGC
jgi:hypothetical protein